MVVIVIISVLTGFAILRMNHLQSNSADACANQARSWFSGLAAKAAARDTTLYVSSKDGHWQAFVLGRKKDKLVDVPVDKLALDPACELVSGHDSQTDDHLPEALAKSWLAVTADGRWLARDGHAEVELTDADGRHQAIELSQLGASGSEASP